MQQHFKLEFDVLLCDCFREHKFMMQRKVRLLISVCLTLCKYLAGLGGRSMTRLDMELLLQCMINWLII